MGKGNRNRDKRKTEKNYPIKEIIYTDEIQLNSVLAQLDEGLMTALELTNQALSGKSTANTTTGTLGVNGGVGIINGKGDLAGTKSLSETENNMSQQVIKTIYNDYAINVLEARLGAKLKRFRIATEGSFVKHTSSFKLFNPKSVNESFRNLSKLMPFIDPNYANEDVSDFNLGIEVLSSVNKLAGGNCIFSFGDKEAIAIASNDNFRRTFGQLQAIQARNSNLTILGIVENIVTRDILSFEDTPDDLSDPDELSEFINSFTSKFNFLVLQQLGFIKPGTKIVHPIAIYFE